MDVLVSSRSKRRQEAKQAEERQEGRSGYTERLSMYNAAPEEMEVSIEEFEELALDRLKVLKFIESARAGGMQEEALSKEGYVQWKKLMRLTGKDTEANKKKDIVSHFVLRLGYCKNEELRRWFLSQECSLFRLRFKEADQQKFLEEYDLPYKPISDKEKEEYRKELIQVAKSVPYPMIAERAKAGLGPLSGDELVSGDFYKVPFEEVPDLVSRRSVLLKKGFAFVPSFQLTDIVVGIFRATLSKALVVTNRMWNARFSDEEAERLTPIVESFSSRYLGEDYSDPAARGASYVGLKDLDRLAHESFPMCMRHLFVKLREEHHLRNGGRMQLGLFLKGIGLRLEDALIFWKAEFSQNTGAERFEKEYAYGIRHKYGKEGKRTNYTPFSCPKIIQSTPGVGDHHGCPFRHFSEDNLAALLHRVNVPANAARKIQEKAKYNHYQIACGMTFSATQGQPCPDAGVSHPNQYYDWSIKARQGVNLSEPTTSTPVGPP